ncbi:MAG TPA: response regulator transcription factor [Sedimentisphaerales bacterium]|nr:response regulator transcription factor [Sedimentisphaerales bacterium]HRS11057.1 response regulator transcription factor [Sedimentisphaerales bacterium]HRV47735.1 response regulator transcription factor [Sedimentisphaerales bacterium]
MRIVLVADDRILCDGLRALFGQDSMTEVIGETHSGPEAVELVGSLRPEIVLIDLGSWTSANMDTIRRISQTHPPGRIVALSPIRSQAFVAEAFRAGIHAYVLKQNGFDELLLAVKTVHSGSTYLCRGVRELLLPDYAPSRNSGRRLSEACLTERESAVLQLLTEGRTSKEIALVLEVSSKTIDACRRQIMRKLEVDSMAGLVKRALAMGVATLTS